jgi:hypothetical protein
MKPLKLTPTGAHLPEGFDHKRDGCQKLSQMRSAAPRSVAPATPKHSHIAATSFDNFISPSRGNGPAPQAQTSQPQKESSSDRQLSSSVRSTDLLRGPPSPPPATLAAERLDLRRVSITLISCGLIVQGSRKGGARNRADTLPGGTSYPLQPGFLIVGAAALAP